MTADWRATLERVAEKLASAKERPTIVLVDQDLDEARDLLRGLLAEPQPDEVGDDFAMSTDECRAADEATIAALRAEVERLAEPQVNPSEARHWLILGRGPDDETFLAWDAETAEDHRKDGYRVDGPFVLAGLLAEGEESRKP